MMYAGLRIKTPHSEFIKQLKYDNGDTIYSFFYNYFVKNKETNKYEVAEAYVVNVTNIMPKPDSEIICTKIISYISFIYFIQHFFFRYFINYFIVVMYGIISQ